MINSNFISFFDELVSSPYRYLVLLTQLFFLCSCSAFEGEQKTNVNEIIKTQEIRQLSKADVMLAAELFGKNIHTKIDSLITISDSTTFKSMIDSLATTFEGKITFGKSKEDFLLREEKALFEAYQYSQDQNIVSKNAIQMIDDKTALYSIPFFDKNDIDRDSTLTILTIVYPTKSAIINMD